MKMKSGGKMGRGGGGGGGGGGGDFVSCLFDGYVL